MSKSTRTKKVKLRLIVTPDDQRLPAPKYDQKRALARLCVKLVRQTTPSVETLRKISLDAPNG